MTHLAQEKPDTCLDIGCLGAGRFVGDDLLWREKLSRGR